MAKARTKAKSKRARVEDRREESMANRVHLRVTDEVWEKIKASAVRNGRNYTQECRIRLERSFESPVQEAQTGEANRILFAALLRKEAEKLERGTL